MNRYTVAGKLLRAAPFGLVRAAAESRSLNPIDREFLKAGRTTPSGIDIRPLVSNGTDIVKRAAEGVGGADTLNASINRFKSRSSGAVMSILLQDFSSWSKYIQVSGQEHIDATAGKPLVIVQPHIGPSFAPHMALISAGRSTRVLTVLPRRGVESLRTVVSKLNPSVPLERLGSIHVGNRTTKEQCVETLTDGGVICWQPDVVSKGDGIPVRFMGRTVRATPFAIELAERNRAEVLLAHSLVLDTTSPALAVRFEPFSWDRGSSVEETLQALYERVETIIVDGFDQWEMLWRHSRALGLAAEV